MKKLSILILFTALHFGLHAQERYPIFKDGQLLTSEHLNDLVSYLSADDRMGRANGSPEMKEVAAWLAERFKEYDIQPFAEYPGFIQDYSFSRRNIDIDERNVIGYIEGSDPDLKDEYIIITAHFDHVGVRSAVDGDSIYNGADDNAAGTATLLGIAKALKMAQKSPGRSLIFAAVSGEEMGLHGSRHLVNNSPVPLSSLYANINFEMTGHSEELGKGNYYMTGCSFTNLDDIITEFTKGSQVNLIDTIEIADTRLFFMSDNLSFARIRQEDDLMYGIPSSTFATSTQAPHIHKPIDEIALFDLDNMAILVNYFSDMVLYLSNCEEAVEWTSKRFKRIE